MNVCGLESRLRCPEFLSFINEYDIIGLQETKTDLTDTIHIDGFKTHIFNRKKLSRYRSGGIALFIKDKISSYVSIDTNTNCKLIQFFTISSKIVKLSNNEDLKCGIIYIPPSGSRYRHEDPYSELQSELFRYCENNSNILLFGDYNSRVSNISD